MAAGVYFAPEAQAAYEALGFEGSPAADKDGVARPELKSYFTSRGACMGQVPGEVVATAFGCFNPPVVVAAVAAGWQIASREAILDAANRARPRCSNAVLGDQPEGLGAGHRLAAPRQPTRHHGLAARSTRACARSASPASPLGAMWRAADLLREHRGDSHVITWSVGGVDAVEILLLTEQWWGMPAPAPTPPPVPGRPTPTWTPGSHGFTRRGLMTDDEQLTDAGRAFREEIEVRTDELERPSRALGDDIASSPNTSRLVRSSWVITPCSHLEREFAGVSARTSMAALTSVSRR